MKKRQLLFVVGVFLFLAFVLSGAADEGSRKVVTEIGGVLPPSREQPECVDPIWPMPEGVAVIELSRTTVEHAGEPIDGLVTIHDLSLLQNENVGNLGPFYLILQNKTPGVVSFTDGKTYHEHIVETSNIQPDGTYSFPFDLIGLKEGEFDLALGWKFSILTEGCCAVALQSIYIGCGVYSGSQGATQCVCDCLKDMPAPGSWCCKLHPKTFRIAWSLWGCSGKCPY